MYLYLYLYLPLFTGTFSSCDALCETINCGDNWHEAASSYLHPTNTKTQLISEYPTNIDIRILISEYPTNTIDIRISRSSTHFEANVDFCFSNAFLKVQSSVTSTNCRIWKVKLVTWLISHKWIDSRALKSTKIKSSMLNYHRCCEMGTCPSGNWTNPP